VGCHWHAQPPSHQLVRTTTIYTYRVRKIATYNRE
jgi:hypothetical protein